MARNEFETEVGQLLNRYFPRVIRIPDSNVNRSGGFQVSQKPYDYCGATANGGYFSAEVKRVKQPRFAFRLLKEHQQGALFQDVLNGLRAFVFINWRVDRKCGKAVMMPYMHYITFVVVQQLNGRKSIKPEHIDDIYFLKRITGGWDLTPELKELYADIIIHHSDST